MPATTKPGVQKPHCSASFSTKAACSGLIFSGVPMPSTVVTSWPSASAASIRHDAIGAPSSSTVQAPQPPRSQTGLAPVRSSSLRSASSSVTRGSTVTARAAPFTFRFSVTASGPRTAGAASARSPAPTIVVAAAETPADFRKLRREKEGCSRPGSSGGGVLRAMGTTSAFCVRRIVCPGRETRRDHGGPREGLAAQVKSEIKRLNSPEQFM